jgi:hypothetical protein
MSNNKKTAMNINILNILDEKKEEMPDDLYVALYDEIAKLTNSEEENPVTLYNVTYVFSKISETKDVDIIYRVELDVTNQIVELNKKQVANWKRQRSSEPNIGQSLQNYKVFTKFEVDEVCKFDQKCIIISIEEYGI